MLDEEFQYYLDNQESLVNLYNNKYITIQDKKVIGVFNSDLEAYKDSVKNNLLGKVLIMHCVPGIESYTQTFHSRVVFK